MYSRLEYRGVHVAVFVTVASYVIHESTRVVFGGHMSDASLYGCWYATMIAISAGLRTWWPSVYFVGIMCNRLAMLANGGRMPVMGSAPATSVHVAADESTRLPWLIDRFVLLGKEASVGDFLIVLALWGLLCVAARRLWRY